MFDNIEFLEVSNGVVTLRTDSGKELRLTKSSFMFLTDRVRGDTENLTVTHTITNVEDVSPHRGDVLALLEKLASRPRAAESAGECLTCQPTDWKPVKDVV